MAGRASQGRAGLIAQAQPLTTGNQTIENFDVSPDGQWLVFDSDRSGRQQIYRVHIGGSQPEQLTNDSEDLFHPEYSPDGRELAMHGFRDGHRLPFVMPADGGPLTRVTMDAEDRRLPQWSPNGRQLLVITAVPFQRTRYEIISKKPDGQWSAPLAVPVVL